MVETRRAVGIAAVPAAERRDEAMLRLSSIGDGADMEQNASREDGVENALRSTRYVAGGQKLNTKHVFDGWEYRKVNIRREYIGDSDLT